jgi:hypothetical protein
MRGMERSDGVLCQGLALRYAFIRAHVGRWKVSTMCRVLMVSKAGYYAWRQRTISDRGKRDLAFVLT